MEAGECGLTRGTCFAARRLELVAVACGFRRVFWVRRIFFVFFVRFFSFERTRPAASMGSPCLIHILQLVTPQSGKYRRRRRSYTAAEGEE